MELPWLEAHSMQFTYSCIYIYIYIYIHTSFNGSCSSCVSYGMASLPTLSLAAKSPGEDPLQQLSPGMQEAILVLLKYCSKDVYTLETPMAKL